MRFTVYALPHVATTVILLFVAAVAWRRRYTPGASAFAAMLFIVAFWTFNNIFEILSLDLATKSFWVKLEYIGICTGPVFWFIFALQYTERGHWLTRWRALLLFLIPALSVLFIFTNSYHGLMRYNISLDTTGPFSVIKKTYGPWFYFQIAYTYLLWVVATYFVVQALWRSHHIYRAQGLLLLLGAVLPLAANVGYIFGYSILPRLDPTPAAFAISGVLGVLSLLHFQTLDLVPAARSTVFESIDDGVIVFDRLGRVVDHNSAAALILRLGDRVIVGQPGNEAVSPFPVLVEQFQDLTEGHSEVGLGEERYFALSISAINARGKHSGWVAVLRDISKLKETQAEREALILELQEALKNIRTLSGLIPICASCKRVRDDTGYWEQVEEYVRRHSEADFTHAICPECMAKLYPEVAGNNEAEGSDA